MLRLAALLLLPALAAPVLAGDSLGPVIPEANARFSEAQGCVEPVDDMRRNHMEYILHHRDKTVYDGIRTKRHSLNECISCHVSTAPDAPRHDSPEHFCSSCHTFAAVRIDCFSCHADRPEPGGSMNTMAPGTMPLQGHPAISGASWQPLVAEESANE